MFDPLIVSNFVENSEMKINTETLITDLIERTKQISDQVESLKQKTEIELNEKKNQESWSVLECIEHLNLYGEFYIQEIEQKINQRTTNPEAYFRSGFIGNKFANSTMPSDDLKKIKTFKDKTQMGVI